MAVATSVSGALAVARHCPGCSAVMISSRLQTTLVSGSRYQSSHFGGEEVETHPRTRDLGQAAGKGNLCVIGWVPAGAWGKVAN